MIDRNEITKPYYLFIKELSWIYSKRGILRKSDYSFILNRMSEYAIIPAIRPEIQKYFLHPNVLSDLLNRVFWAEILDRNDRISLRDEYSSLSSLIKEINSWFIIDFRILMPGSDYPNIDLQRRWTRYTIYNQIPVLQTKKARIKWFLSETSVIHWLSREELKFLSCLMCAPEIWPIPFLNFSYHDFIRIDECVLASVPDNLKISFLKEYLDIKNRFTPIGSGGYNRKRYPDISDYEFINFEISLKAFNKLFDSFSIRNDLLLRTCNHFVKWRLHWNNPLHYEEAIVNNFICLEGCLHLIQKKFGDYTPKINMKLLSEIFKKEFHNWENLFEFIKEAYEKRISLVHPEPEWWAEWNPWIMSDDYYEYFSINRMLLRYILIDDKLATY